MHVEKKRHKIARRVCARAAQINSVPAISSLSKRDGFGKCVWSAGPEVNNTDGRLVGLTAEMTGGSARAKICL